MTITNYSSDEFYESSDLSLATALALFYPLDSIDRTNPKKAIFVFKRHKQMDQVIEAFWRGELKVDPQAYFIKLKSIKARLYSEGDRNERS